jgi:hypothetical protein
MIRPWWWGASVVVTAALVGLGSAAEAAPLVAQTPDAPQAGREVGCLRGRPLDACRSFWIVEMQGQTPLVQTTREVTYGGGFPSGLTAFENELEWNLGHMVNVTPKIAIGGVLSAGTNGGSGVLAGLKVRVRRWLTEDVSLEAEGGLLRTEDRYPAAHGVTADLRVNVRDQGSFFVRWDGVDIPPLRAPEGSYFDPGGFEQAISVGVGLGSVPALVGTGALGLGYVILLGMYLAHGD